MFEEKDYELFQGDALETMSKRQDKSVDLILVDLPYGVTNNKWDIIIPFDLMWEQLNRIIKPNGAIVLFGKQPFTSSLINSNIKVFREVLICLKQPLFA